MLASAGVKVSAEVLESTALKLSTFNAGSVQSFKSADAVNALMNSADGAKGAEATAFSMPSAASMSNLEVRQWYLAQEAKIPGSRVNFH